MITSRPQMRCSSHTDEGRRSDLNSSTAPKLGRFGGGCLDLINLCRGESRIDFLDSTSEPTEGFAICPHMSVEVVNSIFGGSQTAQ
jgi:hypothetical protein